MVALTWTRKPTKNSKVSPVKKIYTLNRLLGIVAVVLLLVSNVVAFSGNAAQATGTVTSYSQSAVITPPPASSFAGAAGGDGWGVSFTQDKIYNIFHHNSYVSINCHIQATAAICPSFPLRVRDSNNIDYDSTGSPSMWIDQANQKLYTYVTYPVTNQAGVLCIDIANPGTPNCGFTALTAAGDSLPSPSPFIFSMVSPAMFVGTKWYAFNYYTTNAPTGTQDTLMCFDTATLAACPSQPYSFDLGTTNIALMKPPNGSIAFGTKMFFQTMTNTTTGFVSCYDTATNAECAGNYPFAETLDSVSAYAPAPFPILDNTGAYVGYCITGATFNCYDMTGNTMSPPSGFQAAMPAHDQAWAGNGYVILGTRLYVPDHTIWTDSSQGQVDCYDFSAQAGCANYPLTMANQNGTYTVNFDPFYPTCLWVNADSGSAQIQSFDAYTTGACGSSGTIVPLSTFVNTDPTCMPATYTSLTVTDPAPSAYSGGTVQFLDASGNPIVGIPTQDINATTGSVDLTSLGLESQLALPQAKISLPGAPAGNVTISMAWTATYDSACTTNGQTAVDPNTTTTTTTTSTTTTVASTTTTTAPATTTTTQPLAFTGSNTRQNAMVAVDMLAGGFVAMLFVRRRKSHS